MVLIKLFAFFTFSQLVLVVALDTCPKGHKVKKDGGACEPCPDGYYMNEENTSLECKPCTKCQDNRGSSVKQKCTKETNTICECRGAFVPWDRDSSTCKCEKGYGLTNGVCAKCKDGYYNLHDNSACKVWTECEAGVKTHGTSTSDVICNESRSNSTSYIPSSPPQRPREGIITMNIRTTTRTTTSTGPPEQKFIPKQKGNMEPSPDSNSGDPTGLVLIMLGIVGLLLLTAVTCKMHNASCVQRRPVVRPNESLCRRPVEESGDSSLLSLKLNPQEP